MTPGPIKMSPGKNPWLQYAPSHAQFHYSSKMCATFICLSSKVLTVLSKVLEEASSITVDIQSHLSKCCQYNAVKLRSWVKECAPNISIHLWKFKYNVLSLSALETIPGFKKPFAIQETSCQSPSWCGELFACVPPSLYWQLHLFKLNSNSTSKSFTFLFYLG